MNVTRSQTGTGQMATLAQDLARLNAPCVGCADCRGLCRALIEAMVLPDLILNRRRDGAPDTPGRAA
jgi:hypothetical protein